MTLPKNVEDVYPLSPMQRLMLLHAIPSGGNGVLLNQVGYDIRGPLDPSSFHRAWDALVARHPALRTAFLWEGLQQPLQVVRTAVTLPFRHGDLTGVPANAQSEAIGALRREDFEAPMVLGKAPLMRCTLVGLEREHHYFLWTVHHLVVDRWSHAVLFADLRAMYAAFIRDETPSLGRPASVRDYIEWIAHQDRAAAERFWRDELRGLGEPTLLTEAAISPGRGERLTTRRPLPPDLTAALRARAAGWRTTPGAMLLSAVALLVAARTGRDDVLCGVTVSGRPPELPDAEAMVGCFVNNLPARLTVQREQPVGDWVRELQRAQGRRQAFGHVSLADIHAWSDVPPARPLFDTLVLLNLTDESDLPWPGIDVVADSVTLDAGYPLLLSVTVEENRLTLTLVHDATLEGPQELLAQLEALIERLSVAVHATLVGELLPPPTVASIPGAAAAHWSSRTHTTAPIGDDATTAGALLRAWRDVLGSEEIGLDDDFFALGGTSLQAAQLFARVERIAGKALPLSTLLGAGSVRALLAEFDHPLPRTGALVRLRSSGTRAPVYAIPGIGGNVVGLAGLARALGPDQPLFAFESPGLDGREPPLPSIDAIADRYMAELVREPEGPFHLFGLCWGAAVVAEMTRKLTALGRPPTSLALIDPTALLRETEAPPSHTAASFLLSRLDLYWDEFREGDWGDRTRLLASKARRAAKLLAGGETRAESQGELHRFRVAEANKNAVLRYTPAPLEARARLFITPYRGEGDDPRLEWLSLIEPQPDVVPIQGVNAGDAISPAHVGAFAGALLAWLRTPVHEPVAKAPAGDVG